MRLAKPTALLPALLLLLPCQSSAAGREKDISGRPMLTQDNIDATIQSAYEEFSMAMSEAGTGFKPEQAIAEAKSVVTRMKSIAKSDVNRNYILWKVSELEYQVYLEERDIVQREQERRLSQMNELVDRFNAETARERPDFVALAGIQEQLGAVNEDKADEVATLIQRRSAGVSRAVLTELTAALGKNDLNKARRTLDYCEANRGHLAIGEAQYEEFEGKLQTRVGVTGQKRYVEEDIASVARLTASGNLREAWSALGLLDRKLGDLKGSLSAGESAAYRNKRGRLEKALDTREDSLVDAAIALYNSRGRAATRDYMERTLKRIGVSRDKLAVIDQAMMGDAVSESTRQDTTMSEEYVALSSAADAASGNTLLRDLTKKARIRAQEREDSAMIAQAEQQEQARQQYEQQDRERLRADAKVRRAEERRLAREAKKRGGVTAVAAVRGDQFAARREAAESSLATSSARPAGGGSADQERAQQNIVLIYALLERDDATGAYERFVSLREPLQRYIIAEAFATLEATVMAAYQAAGAR